MTHNLMRRLSAWSGWRVSWKNETGDERIYGEVATVFRREMVVAWLPRVKEGRNSDDFGTLCRL